jgi:glycosyltransferase involved in cell wall biosynthesis
MAAADGFMFTSRQEPFGLVMVEAAWLGKPIVAFDKSGGPTEFISEGIGTLVPHLNIPLLVNSMLEWCNQKINYDFEKAQKKALEFGAEKKVQEWHQIIDRFPGEQPELPKM